MWLGNNRFRSVFIYGIRFISKKKYLKTQYPNRSWIECQSEAILTREKQIFFLVERKQKLNLNKQLKRSENRRKKRVTIACRAIWIWCVHKKLTFCCNHETIYRVCSTVIAIVLPIDFFFLHREREREIEKTPMF